MRRAATLLALLAGCPASPDAGAGASVTVKNASSGAPASAAPSATSSAPPPPPTVMPDVPDARSQPPTVAEWGAAREVNAAEPKDVPKGCSVRVVREWLKANCKGKPAAEGATLGVTDPAGAPCEGEACGLGKKGGDYFTWVDAGKQTTTVDLVVRMRKGTPLSVALVLGDQTAAFSVEWPDAGPEPLISLRAKKP